MTAVQVTEKQWQAQVLELLALRGFHLVYHTYDSRRSPAGFPDLVAYRDDAPGCTFAILELKSAAGRLTVPQAYWLDAWATLAATVNPLCENVRVITGAFRPADADLLAQLLQERQP